MWQAEGRDELPAYGLEEAIVIHPVLVFLITQDGDSPRTHKRQLENLPLLVRDLPLLVADAPFFPQNRDGPAVGNLVDAQTRDATEMPLKIAPSPLRLCCFQLV
jgi:hypothetical protein